MTNIIEKLLKPKAATAPTDPIGKKNCEVVKSFDLSHQMKLVYYQCSYVITDEAAANMVHGYKLSNNVIAFANSITEAAIRSCIATVDLNGAIELPESFAKAMLNRINSDLGQFNLRVETHDFSL